MLPAGHERHGRLGIEQRAVVAEDIGRIAEQPLELRHEVVDRLASIRPEIEHQVERSARSAVSSSSSTARSSSAIAQSHSPAIRAANVLVAAMKAS